jgi:NitT/TauT family transport system substrate-binding protein
LNYSDRNPIKWKNSLLLKTSHNAMEVYQIRVFLEVARHLSFTEAADVLNLTQPAVSAKIKSLETELGTPLFHRLGRKIELTEVGLFLLENGPKLIQIENELLQEIDQIKKGKLSILRVGCTAEIANGWLPSKLFEYRQQYPHVQTQCSLFDSVELLYRAIANHQIDAGFSDINFSDVSEISTTTVDTIQYALFVAPTHPLAHQQWLSLSDLKDYPWVLLSSNCSSRMVLEARLTEIGLSLADFPQVETVNTASLMRTYILQGGYLGFVSRFEFQMECQSGNLVAIPLQEFALPGSIFLLTPKRIEATACDPGSRRSARLSPVQNLVQLLQPAPVASAMRLRSPDFTLRTLPQRSEVLTLSIGIQNGTIPAVAAGLIVQRLQLLTHFLPQNGRYRNVQFRIAWQNFTTGAPIVTGLRSGALNIGILGDYPLLLSALPDPETQTHPTRLVSFVSSNPDGSCNAMIVPSRSKLKSIADLRGRVLAVPLHSSAHGMVMRSLKAANLLSAVDLIALEHEQAVKSFRFPLHLADSYAHFAPFHHVACRRGHFRYLSDSNLSGLPAFYGIVVNRDFADHYPEVVIAYLKALTAAQSWYDTTPSAPALVGQWTHLETDLVTQILSAAYQPEHTGRFFLETLIRPDWLKLHIDELSQIPSNENLTTINLDRWIQTEFLDQAQIG